MAATRYELQSNLKLTGFTKEQVAKDLNISLTKLDNLLNLNQESLNDPWILRNYLLEKVKASGQIPVPFTALKGDWHQYWFLNSTVIDNQQMSSGDN